MKTSELRHALELVKPGLARKELLEQATSIIFKDDKVWTFNDEVAVVVPLKIGLIGAVPADPLYKLLAKLPPDGDLRIEEESPDQKQELRFSCGRNRAGIRRDEEIRLPLDEEIGEPEGWQDLPEGFTKALDRVLFSCAQGGHRPILTCVHITDNHIESCDGFRMTRIKIKAVCDDICIVGKNLENLTDYSPIKFGFSDNWIQFLNKDNVRYAVRMVEGDYPSLDQFIEFEGQDMEFPAEDVKKALDWAKVIADDSIKYKQNVDLSIQKGKLIVKGEGPDGWAEETLRLKYNGPVMEFKTNPIMFQEMLELGGKIIVGKESLKIESDGYVHVVSLENEE